MTDKCRTRVLTIYIHTINGEPATFDGNQLCYAASYGPDGPASTVAYSLGQIRKEQAADKKYRKQHGFQDGDVYGYARYTVENTKGGE